MVKGSGLSGVEGFLRNSEEGGDSRIFQVNQ